jgi:hypothetical protein
MARGSNPGERRGGRPKGGKNKATLERAVIAERIMNETQMTGRKLGKEVIEEFMNMFGGIAAAFQPQPAAQGQPLTPQDMKRWGASADEPLFEKYAKLALKAANDLADFQSPKFAPVHAPAQPPENRKPIREKFTISIFDHQGRPAPRHIQVKSTSPSAPTFDANLSRCDRKQGGDQQLPVALKNKSAPRKH